VRARLATDHPRMNEGPTATATLELSLGAQAPEGVLTDGEGGARRFSGWIELAAAIEDWRTANPNAAGQWAERHERRHARQGENP
jgi:hypothetical protein